MKKLIIIISLILFCLQFSCSNETYIPEINQEEIISDIRVDIKGAIKYPGVYIVPSSALLQDVIIIAGGLLDTADSNMINMVLPLYDNQMINIPFKTNSSNTGNLININIATINELTSLPGIGEAKAKNIISYREKNGSFKSIDEIKNVSGIGEDVFNKIKTYITV